MAEIEDTRRKLSWLSNAPWSSAGYGTQTAVVVPRLQKNLDYNVALTAFYGLEGAPLPWAPDEDSEPHIVYPKGFHAWGSDIATQHAKHFGAKVLISLMDLWVADLSMFDKAVKYCPLFPIDAHPLPPAVAQRAAQVYRRLVFSKFGVRTIHEAGMDCHYIPHAYDPDVYYPLDGRSRASVREEMGFPKDAFIIGIVAANKGNPGRKALTEQMLAFKTFKENRRATDAIMVIHTTAGQMGENAGENLPAFANAIGLEVGKDILFPPLYYMMYGYPVEHMRKLYNCFDVLSHVSKGEGFGLSQMEAQACGVPAITGDWTSMPEINVGGWLVEKSEAIPWWYPLQAWQYIPDYRAIADRYEQAYLLSGAKRRSIGRKASEVMKAEYAVDHVIETYWKPALEEIFTAIEDEEYHFGNAIKVSRMSGANDGSEE